MDSPRDTVLDFRLSSFSDVFCCRVDKRLIQCSELLGRNGVGRLGVGEGAEGDLERGYDSEKDEEGEILHYPSPCCSGPVRF